MPRTRMFTFDRQNRELLATIRYGMQLYGYNRADMVAALHIGTDTWTRRLRKPEDFTLAELRRLSQKLRIPLTSLLDNVKEGKSA